MAGLGIGLASVLIMNNQHLGSLVRIPVALQRTETLELETHFPPQHCKAPVEIFEAEILQFPSSTEGASHSLLAASQAGLIIRNLGELTNSTRSRPTGRGGHQ